jgi:hypothetical protein
MQLEAISGQTVLVNWAGATVQSGAVPPGVGGLVAGGEVPFAAGYVEPVGKVLNPPPQAPSIAAAAKVRSNFPIERKLETTSDGIGVPLSVQ